MDKKEPLKTISVTRNLDGSFDFFKELILRHDRNRVLFMVETCIIEIVWILFLSMEWHENLKRKQVYTMWVITFSCNYWSLLYVHYFAHWKKIKKWSPIYWPECGYQLNLSVTLPVGSNCSASGCLSLLSFSIKKYVLYIL